MTDDKVHIFSTNEKSISQLCGDLHEKIRKDIYDSDGAVPVAAVVGVLEIIKMEFFEKIKIKPTDDAS